MQQLAAGRGGRPAAGRGDRCRSERLGLLERRFGELARCRGEASVPEPLVAELRPWLEAAIDTAAAGRVVARGVDHPGAVLFGYPPGTEPADGARAAGERIALFLGPAGPPAWLLTGAGRAIVAAAFTGD